MDRSSRFCLALASLLLLTDAGAQTISGVGSRKCSAFNFALEKNSDAAIDSYLAWAQGYLSAVNAQGAGRYDIAIDHGGLLHALTRHCGANRGDRFYEAVAEIAATYR